MTSVIPPRCPAADAAAPVAAAARAAARPPVVARGAAAAFGKWAGRARADARCVRRWARLVFRAETSVAVVLPRLHALASRAPPWRLTLYQRASRVRAYHKRGFARHLR
ncbi:MAG: hypothetical protein VX152_12045, partial [Pseudomonadota bacterium]|nr:hypothetical protein [Pseudomonadota bacterium]